MPPMKSKDFVKLINKKYGGYIRLINDGTDKHSEEGKVYARYFLFVTPDLNYSSAQLRYSEKGEIFVKNGIFYLINHEEMINYVEGFAEFILEELLK